MATPTSTGGDLFTSRLRHLAEVPLIDTVLDRRSRRFALGHDLRGGPLVYKSAHSPVPLSQEEEAILVFAASGYTGWAFGDGPYAPDGPELSNANIVIRPIRAHDCVAGRCRVERALRAERRRRLPDSPPARLPARGATRAARPRATPRVRRALRALEDRIGDKRPEVERRPPFTPPFNRWSTNVPGSTYFVIVGDITPFVFSLLFFLLGEEMAFTLFDERNHFKPAGIERFMKSKGGHLYDHPKDQRVAAILDFESYILELAAVEQGLMLQNLALAAEALGLGGFPHFAAQKYQWFEALGFRMEDVPLSKVTHRNPIVGAVMSMIGKNPTMKLPLGLEVNGKVTVKPFCPPWDESMEHAVYAFLDYKYGKKGVWTDPNFGPWKDNATVQDGMDRYSQQNIDAVVAYCEYVYNRYGRFPGNTGPLRSLMVYQAHHLDLEFYDRFYAPGAYTDRQREHFARWHGNGR